MILLDYCGRFRKARSVNETSAGFRTIIPTKTEPKGDAATATGACIIELAGEPTLAPMSMPQDGPVYRRVLVLPYGTTSNNHTGNVRLVGWRGLNLGAGKPTLWMPTVLCELAFTLSSTPVGIAGCDVVATELFADTITVTTGSTTANSQILNVVSGAGDYVAYAVQELFGFQKLELSFKVGTATDLNALIALM
jgi:hypothetical protein